MLDICCKQKISFLFCAAVSKYEISWKMRYFVLLNLDERSVLLFKNIFYTSWRARGCPWKKYIYLKKKELKIWRKKNFNVTSSYRWVSKKCRLAGQREDLYECLVLLNRKTSTKEGKSVTYHFRVSKLQRLLV